jgi:hypothetical protein
LILDSRGKLLDLTETRTLAKGARVRHPTFPPGFSSQLSLLIFPANFALQIDVGVTMDHSAALV